MPPAPPSSLPLEVLEHLPVPVCVLDGETLAIRWMNAAYRALAPGAEMLGLRWSQIWVDSANDFDAICRAVLESGVPHGVVDELNLIRESPDGPVKARYFSWSLRRLMLAEGGAWLIGMAEETTAQVHDRKVHALREESYRQLFAANPHPMWVYDAATLRFLDVNDAAIERYGYSRDEFMRMSLLDIRPEEEKARFLAQSGAGSDRGLNASSGWRHLTKAGEVLDVEIRANDIVYEGQPARLVLAHDVTERLAAEREQVRLREQLFQAQKLESIGRLAGGVAHDFNNMLNVILGNAELALREVAPDSPLVEELEEIVVAARRSAEITAQLLAFARKQPVVPQVIDVNDAVGRSLNMLRRLIGSDVELVWMPMPQPWAISMDAVQLQQVLSNLATNSRDAINGPGTIRITASNVTLGASDAELRGPLAPGDYVKLEVEDSGPGIPAERLPHMFEPFFTTKEQGRGTGLGLASAFGIIAQGGGRIIATSPPGRGAVFTILLPRVVEQEIVEPSSAGGTPLAPGHETILLVEDEPAVLKLTGHLLQSFGYTVIPADRPSTALQMADAAKGGFDLILSDVVMPGQRGPELVEALRARWPGKPALLMSGYTGEDLDAQSGGLRGLDLMQKPFTRAELARRVRAALDASRPQA